MLNFQVMLEVGQNRDNGLSGFFRDVYSPLILGGSILVLDPDYPWLVEKDEDL